MLGTQKNGRGMIRGRKVSRFVSDCLLEHADCGHVAAEGEPARLSRVEGDVGLIRRLKYACEIGGIGVVAGRRDPIRSSGGERGRGNQHFNQTAAGAKHWDVSRGSASQQGANRATGVGVKTEVNAVRSRNAANRCYKQSRACVGSRSELEADPLFAKANGIAGAEYVVSGGVVVEIAGGGPEVGVDSWMSGGRSPFLCRGIGTICMGYLGAILGPQDP